MALFWFISFALVNQGFVVLGYNSLLRPADEFGNELQAPDEFCRPPVTSLVNVYGGIANSIVNNDDSERIQMSKVDWSNLLSPAPTAIAIMGNLLLVTATRDVSLADRPPVGGWKLVRRPNSLRASILQVSDEAYRALLNAHHNMDRIRLQTGNVPIYFKKIVKLLMKGKAKEKELYLPLTLNRIDEVAMSCSYLANSTAQQFKNVSALVRELLAGCVGTQQLTEDELEQVEIELTATDVELQRVEESVNNYEKSAKEATRIITESFAKLQQAIDDSPDGFELFLANLGDAVLSYIKLPSRILGNFGIDRQSPSSAARETNRGAEALVEIFNFRTLVKTLQDSQFNPLNLFKKLIKGGNSYVRSAALNMTKQLDFKINEKFSMGQFKHIPEDLKDEVNSLFQSGINIFNQIANKSKVSLNSKINETLDELENHCTQWATRVGALVQRFEKSLGVKPMDEISMATKTQIDSNPSGSLASQMLNSWRHKVASQQQYLERAQLKYEFEQRRLDRANRHAGKLLAEFSRLNMTEINLKDAIRILKEAIKELSRLQEQWRHLERFFLQVSRIISDKWQKRMYEFSEEIRVMLNAKGLVKPLDIGTDILYKSAFRATSLSYRIHRLADTYVRVSDAHFLPPLITMSRLLSLDPRVDSQGFEAERIKLNRNVGQAESDIKKLILEDRRLLKEGLMVYRNNIHQQFEVLCPPDEKDERQIRKITEESVKIGNEQPSFDFAGGL